MEEILEKILSDIQNTNVRLENLETVHEDLAAEQGIIKKCLETLDKGQEKFTVGQGELKLNMSDLGLIGVNRTISK